MTFHTENILDYLLLFAGVLVVVFVPYISRVASWFVTIVHETGHGVMSIILPGVSLSSFKLHSNGAGESGSSHQVGPFYKLSRIIELFSGYSFPIYLGTAMIAAAALFDNTTFGVIVLVAMGVLTLVYLRNWFGLLILVVYFSVLFVLWALRMHLNEEYVIVFMGLLFLVRGLYDLISASVLVFGEYDESGSDFHLLEEETHIPAKFWYVFYILFQFMVVVGFYLVVPIDISIV